VLAGRQGLEHPHLERCGKVTWVAVDDLDPIREQIRQLLGYRAYLTHDAIIGEQCARRQTSTTPKLPAHRIRA
jgi:hypothetical protein